MKVSSFPPSQKTNGQSRRLTFWIRRTLVPDMLSLVEVEVGLEVEKLFFCEDVMVGGEKERAHPFPLGLPNRHRSLIFPRKSSHSMNKTDVNGPPMRIGLIHPDLGIGSYPSTLSNSVVRRADLLSSPSSLPLSLVFLHARRS